MPSMRIVLQEYENVALKKLAERELRDPRSQALLIIRRELERCGLLEGNEETSASQILGDHYAESSDN
ncbi:MAG: hypothetical protein KC421_24420 [Anaerolineales bacterium]|nr:hypothetical protein [Anaerolineales bacterium]